MNEMTQKKKIFITGATGFVGNHLARKLLADGHEVYILVRTIHKLNDFPLKNAHIISGELKTTSNSWISELPEDLDMVYHSAGLVHSMSRRAFFKNNTDVTLSLFEDLKNKYMTRPLHFVFLSSLAATGPSIQGRFVNEESKNIPVSQYGKSKKKTEEELCQKVPGHFKLTIIRPPMIIGPQDTAVLDVFKMVKTRFIVTPGINGKNKEYSFVNVFDLVSALEKLITVELKEQTNTFFISHPKRLRFKDLINEVKKEMNMSVVFFIRIPMPIVKILARLLKIIWSLYRHHLRLTPDKVRELMPYSWCCESEKSVRLLGMRYQYDLNQTVKMTLRDYEERGWL